MLPEEELSTRTRPMTTTVNPMKVLFWDIETAPMVVVSWGLWNQTHQPADILEDWYMICAAWRWEGEDKIETVSLLDDPERFEKSHKDDYYVTKTLHELLSKADVIVAHNGDNFDLKKFNARALEHGFDPLPPIATVDTLKVARKNFKLSSNRLDYVGRFLGVGAKIDTPKGLWLRALKGDVDAIETMVEYNKGDITLLQAVYERLLPFISNHPNRNLFRASYDNPVCPKCASKKLTAQGTRISTRLGKRQQWQCQACGGWSTTKAMTHTADMR